MEFDEIVDVVREETKVCPLNGDANECERCTHFPSYEYNVDTGGCERKR